jgi:hypothetical protein
VRRARGGGYAEVLDPNAASPEQIRDAVLRLRGLWHTSDATGRAERSTHGDTGPGAAREALLAALRRSVVIALMIATARLARPDPSAGSVALSTSHDGPGLGPILVDVRVLADDLETAAQVPADRRPGAELVGPVPERRSDSNAPVAGGRLWVDRQPR